MRNRPPRGGAPDFCGRADACGRAPDVLDAAPSRSPNPVGQAMIALHLVGLEAIRDEQKL
jgi:hypothetical protein